MLMKYKKIIGLFFACIITQHTHPKQKITPLKKGNLALPGSQQPSPLFSIGQNVVDKDVVQLFSLFNQIKANNEKSIQVVSSFLYGITDKLSFLAIAPINLYLKPNDGAQTGIQNITTEFEYALYKNEKLKSQSNATIVGNISFPTISSGSFSFLLGTTLSRTAIDWYLFISPAALLATSKHGTKTGNQYFLQCGFGRNIPSPSNIIATLMVELNGFLSEYSSIQRLRNANSGGQIIYLGPSLWIASKNFLIQGGIALPIYQHLNGKQNKINYLLAINTGITL